MGVRVKVYSTERLGTVGIQRRGTEQARMGRPVEIRFPSYDGMGHCSIWVSFTSAQEIEEGLRQARRGELPVYDTTGEKE